MIEWKFHQRFDQKHVIKVSGGFHYEVIWPESNPTEIIYCVTKPEDLIVYLKCKYINPKLPLEDLILGMLKECLGMSGDLMGHDFQLPPHYSETINQNYHEIINPSKNIALYPRDNPETFEEITNFLVNACEQLIDFSEKFLQGKVDVTKKKSTYFEDINRLLGL